MIRIAMVEGIKTIHGPTAWVTSHQADLATTVLKHVTCQQQQKLTLSLAKIIPQGVKPAPGWQVD